MKNFLTPVSAVFALLIAATACVDDYDEVQRPRPVDAPAFAITLDDAGDMIEFPEGSGTYYIAHGGQGATLRVTVIDAPGVVSSASATASADQISATANPASIIGQTEGSFTVSLTSAATIDPAFDIYSAAPIDVTVSVTDSQDTSVVENGFSLNLRQTISEVFSGINVVTSMDTGIEGEYRAVTSGTRLISDTIFSVDTTYEVDEETGVVDTTFVDEVFVTNTSYTDVVDTVTITAVRPGLYRISDISLGVRPLLYGFSALPGSVEFRASGDTVNMRTESTTHPYQGVITGTTSGSPVGTMTLNLSVVPGSLEGTLYGDTATSVLTRIE